MPGLIVSVRTAAEAEQAIAGGATLLDVKEPRRGSLGRPGGGTIESVVRRVYGRLPVSAAMGELLRTPHLPAARKLTYLKWGLSGYVLKDWSGALLAIRTELENQQYHARPVVVAYADWKRARSPRPSLLCEFACARQFAAFLIDTYHKDGSTLMDWITMRELRGIAARCKAARVRLALAGSLGPDEIVELSPLMPDWFAVRGAVCRNGRRGSMIDPHAVRQLADLVVAGGVVTSP
jgi:uncharacterized protein (UPF0264 family)